MSRKQQQPCGTRDEAGGLHPGCWGAAAVAWPAVGDVSSRGVTGNDPQEVGVPPWALSLNALSVVQWSPN